MTSKDAIHDLIAIKDYFESESDASPTCLTYAVEWLERTKWIPVSERLPEEMGTYLVTLDYKEHGTGVTTIWFHNREIGWDLRVADIVTAWMSLPEPYKGDKR